MFGFAALAGIIWAIFLYALTVGTVVMGINMTWPDPSLFIAMVVLTFVFWPLMTPGCWRIPLFRWIAIPLLIITGFMWITLIIGITVTMIVGLIAAVKRV